MERLRWEIAVPRAKKWHEKWRLYCFERLVNLHRLLLWMVKHGIGTHAEGGRPEEGTQPTPCHIALGGNVLTVKHSGRPDDRRVQEVTEWVKRLTLPGGPLLKIIGPASDSVVFAISQAIPSAPPR